MKLNRTTFERLMRANELLDKLFEERPEDSSALYGYKLSEANERLCGFLETATEHKLIDPFWNAALVEALAQEKIKKDLQYAACIDEGDDEEELTTYTLRIMQVVDDLEKDVEDFHFRCYRLKEDIIEDVDELRTQGYNILP